jgi:uncharacterized membrane protein
MRAEGAIEVERPVEAVYEHLARSLDLQAGDRIAEDAVAWRHDDEGEWRATLISLSPKRTRIDLALEHGPAGLLERAADAVGASGALDRRVHDELARLKADVEANTPMPD